MAYKEKDNKEKQNKNPDISNVEETQINDLDKLSVDKKGFSQKHSKGISGFTIFIMAFIIGLLIIIQLNTAEKVTGGLSASQKSLQLQRELKTIREERELKEQELAELESKLNALKTGAGTEAVGLSIQNEIEKYDKIIGYTESTGPGITVTLTDQADGNLLENNYELILSVINKLNAAGAEGISLNNNRWAVDSYLNLSGGMLYINETPIKAPFVIAAIGDANTLEASLNLRFGILYDLRNNYEIDGVIEKSENIVLPKLNRTIDFEYGQVEVK